MPRALCLGIASLAIAACGRSEDPAYARGSTVVMAVRDVRDLLPDAASLNFLFFLPLAAFYDQTAALRDTMVSRREIALDSAELDRFVGEYAVWDSLVITKENGSLWVHPAGNRRAQLFAEAPTEFFLKVADMQLSFVVDASGTVTDLVVHMSGLDQTGRKYRYDGSGRKVR